MQLACMRAKFIHSKKLKGSIEVRAGHRSITFNKSMNRACLQLIYILHRILGWWAHICTSTIYRFYQTCIVHGCVYIIHMLMAVTSFWRQRKQLVCPYARLLMLKVPRTISFCCGTTEQCNPLQSSKKMAIIPSSTGAQKIQLAVLMQNL